MDGGERESRIVCKGLRFRVGWVVLFLFKFYCLKVYFIFVVNKKGGRRMWFSLFGRKKEGKFGELVDRFLYRSFVRINTFNFGVLDLIF